MPALKNPKHEAFAQAVALGMPASQAYVEFVSRDGKCSARNAEVTGSKLTKDSEIGLRISELRNMHSDRTDAKFKLTKERWLERLDGIADKAESAEDFSAATGALREIGKASDWYAAEKVEHSGAIQVPGLQDAIAATFGRK